MISPKNGQWYCIPARLFPLSAGPILSGDPAPALLVVGVAHRLRRKPLHNRRNVGTLHDRNGPIAIGENPRHITEGEPVTIGSGNGHTLDATSNSHCNSPYYRPGHYCLGCGRYRNRTGRGGLVISQPSGPLFLSPSSPQHPGWAATGEVVLCTTIHPCRAESSCAADYFCNRPASGSLGVLL
jgi:hypothetical protein